MHEIERKPKKVESNTSHQKVEGRLKVWQAHDEVLVVVVAALDGDAGDVEDGVEDCIGQVVQGLGLIEQVLKMCYKLQSVQSKNQVLQITKYAE